MVSAAHGSDYVDPTRLKCKVLVDQVMSERFDIEAKFRAAKSREARCAWFRNAGPYFEKTLRTIHSDASCRAILPTGLVENAQAKLGTMRAHFAGYCSARTSL
jgi:hypothetical protein